MTKLIKYINIVSNLAIIMSLCFASKSKAEDAVLNPRFYDETCPDVEYLVKSIVQRAFKIEPRMAASLLRLHFLDCFVQGCDASLLLDNSENIISEKGSNSNKNSARGFEVIDTIKEAVEQRCPETVSCADILAMVAREATVITGGPHWDVLLGRRDSLNANLSGSNNDIPSPNDTFETILDKFISKGLDNVDLVVLSGAHTIGEARCISYRQRIYNQTITTNKEYAARLRLKCPKSGGDEKLANLDYLTPKIFDVGYYRGIMRGKALLMSDQILLTAKNVSGKVGRYARNPEYFKAEFPLSMVKMGNISPLTGEQGEIRRSCRIPNSVKQN